MKNKFGKLMVLALFIMIFVVACSNASQKGYIEAVKISDTGFVVTRASEKFFPGELIIFSNAGDYNDLLLGSIYELKVADEIATTMPPSATISGVGEKLGELDVQDITFSQGANILGNFPSNSHLIDVRSPEEFQAGHLFGAINIPLDVIGDEIASVVKDENEILILYCRTGNRSSQAGEKLAQKGYKLVFNAGGIENYKGELEVTK